MVALGLLLAVLPAAAVVQTQTRANCTGTLELPAAGLGLADEISLTLTLEGPAPLIVRPPANLGLGVTWRSRPDPAGATRTPLPGERARWQQVFWLSPLQFGPAVPLAIAPLTVRTGPDPPTVLAFAFDPVTLNVTTTLDPTDPGPPRPPTDIDPLPVEPATPFNPWPWLALAGVLMVFVGLRQVRWRRRQPTPTAAEQAQSELATATVAEIPGVLRRYVAVRFGTDIAARTPTEIAADVTVLPAELRDPLAELLEGCDAARFARTIGEAAQIAATAHSWIMAAERQQAQAEASDKASEIA